MRKMTSDEVKQVQIEILDVVSDFCIEHKIKYWLDSGTLIGAVRHKGYIPWDDDIDLGMLRPDFDRFNAMFNENRSDCYRFVCGENSNEFYAAYGKVLDTTTILYEPDEKGYKSSVNIDIFVYDNAPNDDKTVKKMFDKRDRYNLLSGLRNNVFRVRKGDGKIKWVVKKVMPVILLAFPRDFFTKKAVMNSKLYSDKKTNRIGNFTAFSRTVCDVHAFDEVIPVVFEGKQYNAPKGFDEWLRAMYGNYMELPPLEKRVTHHSYSAFWR